MSRFESSTSIAAVPSAAGGHGAAIARIAGCDPVGRALSAVSVSRAAALAIDVADLNGAILGTAPGAAALRGPGRYGVPTIGDAVAVMAAAVIALRRAQLDAYGVRSDVSHLGSGDSAVAAIMLDADAAAFLVHVAAEAAAAGMPALARHVEASNTLAPVVDAYRRGFRKGGGRVGAAMAFEAATADAAFLDRRLDGHESVPGLLSRGLATRLAGSAPAGGAYPDRPFRQSFDRLCRTVAERVEATAEAALGMRAAA